jgi:spermidine synthase
MTHPALFAHPTPKKIAIIGDKDGGILKEVLHHPQLEEIYYINGKNAHQNDARIKDFTGDDQTWANQFPENTLDILINAEEANPAQFKTFFKILDTDGILIQQSESPYHLATLKKLQEHLAAAHFSDTHFIIFPQPNFPLGLRCAIMTKKFGNFRRVREKDIYNKNFNTRYYNLDVHKASLVLPEFMRQELETTELGASK